MKILSPELRARARVHLRKNPALVGLDEGQLRIIEETQHPYWVMAVDEATKEANRPPQAPIQ
jgi:hypothetical protein